VRSVTQNAFLIAAPQSGSGKTTVSLAIMAALTRRAVPVVPFKCGPDFIDPGYHRAVTGAVSRNLDAWMCGDEFVRQTLQARLAAGTIAVIEGAMGLFDGFGFSTMEGSSAQIAAITGAPVVLVLNARGMAASAAPLLNGFASFNSEVMIAGVIFNNVGSENHAMLLRDVVAKHCPTLRCFGCIPRDEAVAIPSRHLGLVTADDNPLPDGFVQHLADVAEKYLDLDRLMKLELPVFDKTVSTPHFATPATRIAVAADQAFCFCYDDNLRLLEEVGAEILPFSPLNDRKLPEGISGIYLPGGYPELFADALAANLTMKQDIQTAVLNGMPTYAECGGFIYLTEGMSEGTDFVGIFPTRTKMLVKRKALGYREVRFLSDTVMGKAAVCCRGHEFHYSEITGMPESVERCYEVTRSALFVAHEGYRINNCLGSYIHLHFGSHPELAVSFVNACAIYSHSVGEKGDS